MSEERKRLEAFREQDIPWKKWGPYLSERQWGTVREDYSENGEAWDYFSHDQARSRAYHWGEDGIAGISDDKQRLCFALALWNGKDPILKERMFGLTNSEGNHGEDVKEYYFYLDSTPTHSYMKYLYKYPQAAYPYEQLIKKNKERTHQDMEYELLDTGIFNEDRYFDVFVEYAKESPEEMLIKISVCNRGPAESTLHLLPTIWFRNVWTWWECKQKPQLNEAADKEGSAIVAHHAELGEYILQADSHVPLLFTENDTNNQRIFGTSNASPYVKDGIHNYVIHGQKEAVNPEKKGTKAAFHYQLKVEGGQTATVCLRLSKLPPKARSENFGQNFEAALTKRKQEADEFYTSITPPSISLEAAKVMRQALASMLWSKQYYFFDLDKWLQEHQVNPFGRGGRYVRNIEWFHMINGHIISMPDKWEYPWYAAWDLAFHSIALSLVDLDFAKEQLDLMLQEVYIHPSGQIPAYEWNFSDVNPPVHAWATLFLSRMEEAEKGKMDENFLRQSFRKLMLNFTWWVNRKDRFGKNVFEGGFLGLDNIGVFDRSKPLPTGGYLEQADGTAWMSFFCQNMLELSIALATSDPTYEDMALKFAEHFLWIASALNRVGEEGMWDEEDGFYYDLLRLPDGTAHRLKVRSIVGLLPLCATTITEKKSRDLFPTIVEKFFERIKRMPDLFNNIHLTGPGHFGQKERGIAALVNKERLQRILTKMLDENEFLGAYGIRSLSKYHLKHPYIFYVDGQEYKVSYIPAESDTGMFGGNSNWRGPIWMPINILIIRALLNYYLYYGDEFKIECPTGSGKMMNLFEVSQEIGNRLISIFLPDKQGNRPVFGGSEKFQRDPHWKDYLLFYEYFHGDNGAGIGASHQTGWTGIIAVLIKLFGSIDPHYLLEIGKIGGWVKK
ncbi:MGH1-like glycoside hydrolase domain-containing protein [Candidatus Protochlamydia phocaeensis]|uniref:MGH1-like glycoside hydrolase domain-containing protein n=1 Tax=Candidatus Protochlamydia phocaeensis TaxID=1414722 RepID=UPI00083974E1|nr:glucosidase [Candidatus Protochlamydia phocaeensis]